MDPLDAAVAAALTGPHAHLAEQHGRALRYPPDVSPFVATPTDDKGWHDLAELLGPGGDGTLATGHRELPTGWTPTWELAGVQLVDDGTLDARPDPEALALGPDDVEEMLALVERTRPGPFARRTITMGTYLGIRDHGALVAMAGERLHLPGLTEISAVCTDPAHRGRGLASRLIRAVAHGIAARGEIAFLHTVASNTTAIRLYEQLGFRLRAHPWFIGVRAPGNTRGPGGAEQSERRATPSTT